VQATGEQYDLLQRMSCWQQLQLLCMRPATLECSCSLLVQGHSMTHKLPHLHMDFTGLIDPQLTANLFQPVGAFLPQALS